MIRQYHLVCDDYSGYKAGFATGITERNDSPIAKKALGYIGTLYEIERQGTTLSPEQRHQLRQTKCLPIMEHLHDGLSHQRAQITMGAICKKSAYWGTVFFCGNCGTPMAYESYRRPREIHFYMGILDTPEMHPVNFHVCYKERLPWLEISDDTKRYPEFP